MVLVTGATGFIGSRLVNALDRDLKIVSRYQQEGIETVVCNLEVEDVPFSALESVDTIFHMAGFSHDVHGRGEIDAYRRLNVRATKELAAAAVKAGVKKFIFVSSVKAGGVPINSTCSGEEYQVNPEDIYGATKREAELALLEAAAGSDMQVSIIRPSLVYGPKVKGNLKLMLSGIAQGWFPPLPEVGNRRSMIHVDDLIRAILLISELKGNHTGVFIVTDGRPHSSREIYNAMCEVLGKPIPNWSVPKTLFDLVSLISPRIERKIEKLLGDECYSSSKLERLGFKAKKSLNDMNETDF